MKFKKQLFGFMDMLRFKELVPKRREALANGSPAPLPKEFSITDVKMSSLSVGTNACIVPAKPPP